VPTSSHRGGVQGHAGHTDLLGEQVSAEFGVLPDHKIWLELRRDSQQVLRRLQRNLTGEQPAEHGAGHRLGHLLRDQPETTRLVRVGGALQSGQHPGQRQVRQPQPIQVAGQRRTGGHRNLVPSLADRLGHRRDHRREMRVDRPARQQNAHLELL
jgi:hypothetical protein